LIKAKPATFSKYETYLLRIVGVGLAYSTGQSKATATISPEEKERLKELPLSVLTDELVENYQMAQLEAANEGRKNSAAISANTYLRQAKSCFSKKLLKRIRKNPTIQLPQDFHHFLEADPIEVENDRYILPNHEVIQALFKWLSDPPESTRIHLYTAIVLAVFSGSRRTETLYLGRHSLNKAEGFGIDIRSHTKNGKVRHMPLSEHVYTWLADLPDKSPFFLGHGIKARREAITGATEILRKLGFDVEKPFHELRKLYGSKIASTDSLKMAQKRLDHESITTTEKFYGDINMSPEISSLWNDTVLVPHSKLQNPHQVDRD
jgi:integrase